jgi:mRNA interferase YafQ
MRKIIATSTFNKDLKGVNKHQRRDEIQKNLELFVNLLATGQDLPPKAKHHPMVKHSPKEFRGCWDFHVLPDMVVVYRMDADSIYLLRIGKHNHLGLTEASLELTK